MQYLCYNAANLRLQRNEDSADDTKKKTSKASATVNYYDVLGVSESAEQDVIGAAYKAMIRRYHPDHYPGDPEEGERRAKELNEAYSVLRDPELRARYNASLRLRGPYDGSAGRSATVRPTYPPPDILRPTAAKRKFGTGITVALGVLVAGGVLYSASGSNKDETRSSSKQAALPNGTAADQVAASRPEANSSAARERLGRNGAQSIRDIEANFSLPATSQEYEAMGKNAVLMLRSSSARSNELPLKAVYVDHDGDRTYLQRLAILPKFKKEGTPHIKQISFYLFPIYLMKRNSRVLADFSKEIKKFDFYEFTPEGGIGQSAPIFLIYDLNDTPSSPDKSAVARLLSREYAQYFPTREQSAKAIAIN